MEAKVIYHNFQRSSRIVWKFKQNLNELLFIISVFEQRKYYGYKKINDENIFEWLKIKYFLSV